MLPTIHNTYTTSSELSFLMSLSEDHPVFNGHFTNAPIVPGVMQIQWVMDLAIKYFPDTLNATIKQISKLKYHHVISPNNKFSLKILFESKNNKLTFKFSTVKFIHSSGIIEFNT